MTLQSVGTATHQLAKKRKVSQFDDQLINGLKERNGESTHANGGLSLTTFKHLGLLYSPSVGAKIWGIAERDLDSSEPPIWYPEYTKPGSTGYVYRDLSFWTSGFFPGSLHLLLERTRKFRSELDLVGYNSEKGAAPHVLQLEHACKWWTENLHQNASLLGTHDLGFMIFPWARVQWDLHRDQRAFDTMMKAANTLADRFSETTGCMRSWDKCQTKCYSFTDTSKDFLVIIDNMMNLELLFWAASQTSSRVESTRLFDIAVAHARTSQKYHVRADSSTCHVVNFDPSTGTLKERLTNQGYSHTSCWARGQAWAIAGFAEAYKWSGEASFLDTAKRCADYFLRRLPDTQIPPWDFDAAETSGSAQQPPDTSAALVAAYGMLVIHQMLLSRSEKSSYLEHALRIVDAVCSRHLNPSAHGKEKDCSIDTVENGSGVPVSHVEWDIGEGDTIVNGATINNFKFAPRRWADHGLVYADYFFLLVGNKLLEMNVLRQML
ncbi:Six-hairpin glycosidase-like protein [Fusarium solani]|uniref:Six-hairpin glycosidase-like protein n=1 Tax=Fusarium solani TaxID=169388 RepID=A0A9P9G3X9_FUSSL|nr:Six-hairpin glycosidase-like protein [Fusarium solani]KAH7231572.1 Six-hairpin glycosidase-like protein [Fusarium solani]